jgi:hypothetical protein
MNKKFKIIHYASSRIVTIPLNMTETELPIWAAYMERLFVLGGIEINRERTAASLDLQEWSPSGETARFKVVEDPHGWTDQMRYTGNYYSVPDNFDTVKLIAGKYEPHEICAIHPRCIQAIKMAYDTKLENISYCRDSEGLWYFHASGLEYTLRPDTYVPVHVIPGLYRPDVPMFV